MSSAKRASPHRKLALIVGNSNYKRPDNHLNHAVENAKKLSDLLETIDFNVTTDLNVNKDMMKNISEFANTITDGDMILFYFSGHSRQVEGENYLMPTDDDRIEKDIDVKDIGMSAQRALDRLTEKNKSYVTIFILDCPKQYFLKKEPASDNAVRDKGLKEMNPPVGTFIQFACAANQTVNHGQTTNGDNLFAKHLLKNITQEDICIPDIFQQIVSGVFRQSNNQQHPLSINRLQQHQQVCLYSMPDEKKINQCNQRIADLQRKLEEFTLKEPHAGALYNPVISARIGKIRASIHTLTLKRNRVIRRCFSARQRK